MIAGICDYQFNSTSAGMLDSSKFKIHVLDTTLPLSHESEYMCICAGLERGWWSSDTPPPLKNLNFLNLHIKIPSKMPQTSPLNNCSGSPHVQNNTCIKLIIIYYHLSNIILLSTRNFNTVISLETQRKSSYSRSSDNARLFWFFYY